MISQADLIAELARTSFPVTARRLTDWRHKGLLPPLVSRGRGQGSGRAYFWEEPDILIRAQFLQIAFANGATAETALLALAHGGFDVEPKVARRVWINCLTKLEALHEAEIESGETARDAYWDVAAKITPAVSEKPNIPENDFNILIAEALSTIYAIRGFRPNDDELGYVSDSFRQYLLAIMAAPRFRSICRLFSRKGWVKRLLELLRQSLSVTATKELIKGTSIEQFDLAISTTRLIVCAVETFLATQLNGRICAEPDLATRMIFRVILGAPLTAFFLQLIGEGYDDSLQTSAKLLRKLIANYETQGGRYALPMKLEIVPELQAVTDALFSDFKQIWRDFSLFRLYNIS